MATLVYRQALVNVNGTDYSGDFNEVSLTYAAEMLDRTVMGDDTRRRQGGLKTWQIELTALQDFTAGHVGAAFFALVGTTTCIEIRPLNSCSTAINPSFSGIATLENFPPQAGAVGSLLASKFTFVSAGSLTRASSS